MARAPPPPGYSEGPGAPRSFHAPSVTERHSTASSNAPFSAIGALLSQPYDSDDEDGRSIRNPQAYQGSQGDVRSGDMRNAAMRGGYGVAEKVQSQEGRVGQQGGGRPKSIVHFPGPQIGHSQNQGDPTHLQASRHPVHSGHARPPPSPAMSSPRFPHPTHPGPRSPHPNRPQPTVHIPHSPAPLSPHPLPKPFTPISPALAASPYSPGYGGLTPPRSAFSGADNRSSVASSSASITAYDSMEKTHSLMRGGEDELMAPVNTLRPQKKRNTSAHALEGFRKTVFGQPGGEFWKRFSVMAKMDDNKER